jgi:uncharacterized protein (UPF0333 family)
VVKCRKNAQVSIEFLFVVGFAFIISAGLAYVFIVQSENINIGITSAQVDKITSEIRDASDEVYYLGSPSKKTLTLYFPQGIEAITFYETSIIFNISSPNGNYEVVKWASSNFSSNSIVTTGTGIHHVTVEARTYDVLVSE